MTRYMPMYVQDGSYAASQDRRLISALWPGPASTGCAVTVASGMTMNVAPGSVAVPTQNNTGSTLCVSDAVEQVGGSNNAAPPAGQTRIDLVICRPRDVDLDGSSNADFIFDLVLGTPATTGSQTVPATPAGTVALYRVTVPGGAAALVAGNLTDVRPWGLSLPGASALPPPLGAGAAFQSFTDANGEVWIAKGGVYGGAWKKAKDVLAGSWYRAAAFTVSASAALNFDGTFNDPYGMKSGANFIVPIAGRYRIMCVLAVTMTGTANIYCACNLNVNGASIAQANSMAWTATGAACYINMPGLPWLSAGDAISALTRGSASVAGLPGGDATRIAIEYAGLT